MERTPLQKGVALWCLAMAALLILLSVIPPRTGIPPVLLGIFVGVWLFGAAMTWWFPTFGAAGTAAWGLLSGVQAMQMHGFQGQNAIVVLGSLAGAALALALLWRLVAARRVARSGA